MGEFQLPAVPYPGEDAISDKASTRYTAFVPSNLGTVDPEQLDMIFLMPKELNWALGDRAVQCVLVSGGKPLTRRLGH
jgi:hypothetical protein